MLRWKHREMLSTNCACGQVSPEGKPLRSLTDLDGQSISGISGVVEHGGRLYFGFLTGDYISYVDLKPALSNARKILA